jgi:S1-C subfamily serine protease
MLVVDLSVGAAILGALLWGLRRGLAGALPLAGFAVGAVLGTRIPLVIGMDLDSTFAPVAALPAALLLGAGLAAVAERFSLGLSRRLRRRRLASAAGGALVAGVAGLVAIWVLAPAVAGVDALREPVDRSTLLARLNDVLTPAGPRPRQGTASFAAFPIVPGPVAKVAAADASAETDPDVLAADRSVVKVGKLTCSGGGSGSGWVVADGIVVTNAHVVDSADALTVRLRGKGPAREATAIWFDPVNDIALLRVPALRGVRSLPMVRNPQGGTSGAALGFPLGVRDIRRARLGPTTSRRRGEMRGGLPSTFPKRLFGRRITAFRGRVQPGSSGGPVVDMKGRVLTTTFGATSIAANAFGVPNEYVRDALKRAGPRVSTGRCRDNPNR